MYNALNGRNGNDEFIFDNGDVKIELSGNDEILIRNELFANIEANDFIFS